MHADILQSYYLSKCSYHGEKSKIHVLAIFLFDILLFSQTLNDTSICGSEDSIVVDLEVL